MPGIKMNQWLRRVVSFALLCTALPPAIADPGGGDAPDTFATAVMVSPGTSYDGVLDRVGDMDYYKFAVMQGQDIVVNGTVSNNTGGGPYGMMNANFQDFKLLDPMGIERDSYRFTSSTSFMLHYPSAMAGDWVVEWANNAQIMPPPQYSFLISLNAPGSGGGYGGGGGGGYGGGGGAWELPATLAFALMAMLRALRRVLTRIRHQNEMAL